jgi:hypothetical protein
MNSSAPGAPPVVMTYGDSLARGEDDLNGPNVIGAPRQGEDVGPLKSKSRSPVRRRKVDLTPLPSSPAANVPVKPAPAVAATAAPHVQDSRAIAAPAPAPAAAAKAPASKPKPAINDVPVDPLD